MNKDFQKILELISKTKDKYIVNYHSQNFVLMELSSYEKLLNVKEEEPVNFEEEELLNKINEEINDWSQSNDEPVDDFEPKVSSQDKEDQYYLEPVD